MKRVFKILLIASVPMIWSFQSFGFSFSPNDVSTLKHQIVLNGNEATAESDSTKFTAHLEILGPKDQQLGVCTGIIVEKDILLTAGHCFAIDGVEKVRVHFGIGGESGFSDSVDTTDYTFWHQKGSEFRNEYADIAQGYEGEKRKEFFNVAKFGIPAVWRFTDFAVIRIPKIPSGYRPIKIYEGKIDFRQAVVVAGHGINTLDRKKASYSLRWSNGEVIGHYTLNGDSTMGWQIFYPDKKPICQGDSGGPLLIFDKTEYKLLGINIFGNEPCDTASWALDILYEKAAIQEAIKDLRKHATNQI